MRVCRLTWYQSLISLGFEKPFYNLFSICLFEISWRSLFGLFVSPHVGIRLHVRESVKGMTFKLNLSRLELLGELVVEHIVMHKTSI